MKINKDLESNIRKSYHELLPVLKKIESLLVSKVQWYLRSEKFNLKEYERISVESRIKSCDSSLEKLVKKYPAPGQEGSNIRRYINTSNDFSLDKLSDLVGIRILVFPSSKILRIQKIISREFSWKLDPEFFAFGSQFQGRLRGCKKIGCEIQIIPMLIGKFWDVEHFVRYKPHPSYRFRIKNDTEINDLSKDIYELLENFQVRFCDLLKKT